MSGTVDFSGADLTNIDNVECNTINATGAIGPLLHCGVTCNNVNEGSGYFDPWNEATVRKGIDYAKMEEYLTWSSNIGPSTGGVVSGWNILKPCLIYVDCSYHVNKNDGRLSQGHYRKYDSSNVTLKNESFHSGVTAGTPDKGISYSQMDYFDTGDKLQVVLRNVSSTTFQYNFSLYVIKDGADISYTDE